MKNQLPLSVCLLSSLFFHPVLFSQVDDINLDFTTSQTLVAADPTELDINSDLSGEHEFDLLDAGVSNGGIVSTGTQTFSGAKTFTGSVNVSGTTGNSLVLNTSGFVYDAATNRIGINITTPEVQFDMTAIPTGDLNTFLTIRNVNQVRSLIGVLDPGDNMEIGLISASEDTKVKFRSNGISFVRDEFTVGEAIEINNNPQFKVVGDQDYTDGAQDMINYQVTVQNHSETNGDKAAIGFGIDATESRIGGYISFIRSNNNSFGSMHFGVKPSSGAAEAEDVLILSEDNVNLPYATVSTISVFDVDRNLTSGSIGSGLSLSSNTLSLNINGLTSTTEPIQVAADYFPMYDNSATSNKKTTLEEMLAQYVMEYRKRRFDYYNEFINGNGTTSGGNDVVSLNGSGGSTINTAASTAGNVVGLVESSTGSSSASGKTAVVTASSAVQLGGGSWIYELGINAIPTLSNSTERYQLLVGFFDNQSGVNQTDAVYFLYDEGGVSSGSAASANWQMVTASNSTRSFTTSGTAVSTGVNTLQIVINSAGTSVTFYIGGVTVGTITTNIPTGAGRETGFGWQLIKSIGTAARTTAIDYISVQCDYTAAK